MDTLYYTVGIVAVVVICLAIIVGGLYLSLFLFGRILKYTGYWKRTLKAVSTVYAEERKAKKNGHK